MGNFDKKLGLARPPTPLVGTKSQVYPKKSLDGSPKYVIKFFTFSDGPRYRIQANQWPLDPLDLIIAEVKKLPKKAVVADFGCGEARLAQCVHRATVHSFDLVAAHDKVTQFQCSWILVSLRMLAEFNPPRWLHATWPMFHLILVLLMWLCSALLLWGPILGNVLSNLFP